MLAPFLEGDRALARSEIDKLILYKGLADQREGQDDVITRQDIADISAVGSEAAMDQILDPALGGDIRAADAAYARGLSAGLNPVGVLRGFSAGSISSTPTIRAAEMRAPWRARARRASDLRQTSSNARPSSGPDGGSTRRANTPLTPNAP